MASENDIETSGLTRRDALKRGAVVGAAVWAAPTVLSVAPAAAVSFQDTGGCDRFLFIKWNLPQSGDTKNYFESGQGVAQTCNPPGVDTGTKVLEYGWYPAGAETNYVQGVPTVWETSLGDIKGTWNSTTSCWKIELPSTMSVLSATVKGGNPPKPGEENNYLCEPDTVGEPTSVYMYCDDPDTRLADPSYMALIVCYTIPEEPV